MDDWWKDLVQRPCLQQPLAQEDAESLCVRFSEDQFELQKPMAEGVRVIKVRTMVNQHLSRSARHVLGIIAA